MAQKFKMSQKAKGYLSATAITDAASIATLVASGNEMKRVKDVTVSQSRATPDVTTRESGGETQYAPGLRDRGVSFELITLTSDPQYGILDTAFNSDDETAIVAGAFIDGDATGSKGVAGNWIVSKFDLNQKNGEAVSYSVELKPYSATQSYTKAA